MQDRQPVVSGHFAQYAEAIRALLPAGADLEALQIRELASLVVPGYTEDIGGLASKLTFPARFVADKPVVVMVGLDEGEPINWAALAGAVDADGNVIIALPQALLVQVQAGNADIAVMR